MVGARARSLEPSNGELGTDIVAPGPQPLGPLMVVKSLGNGSIFRIYPILVDWAVRPVRGVKGSQTCTPEEKGGIYINTHEKNGVCVCVYAWGEVG